MDNTYFKRINEISLFDIYDQVKGHVGVSVIWKDMVFINDVWDQVMLKYMKAFECQKGKQNLKKTMRINTQHV